MDSSVNYKFRPPELEQYRTIWLTREAYELLRKEKQRQKISMAKLIDDLILNTYGDV